MKRSNKILISVTALVAVAVLLCAGIIAYNQLGLVEGYDFGLGAYYYADIPGFEKIFKDDAYEAQVPLWMHILLFLLWGFLMYRLWCWIERK